MTKWWMIRVGEKKLISVWSEKNVASIGWGKLGDLSNYKTKEELLKETNRIYGDKFHSKNVVMHQLWRFCHEVSKGDKVISYLKEERRYIVGTVTGQYFYNRADSSDEYPNMISVEWSKTMIDRNQLSQGAKNSLGSVLTIFRVDKWGTEFESLLNQSIGDRF